MNLNLDSLRNRATFKDDNQHLYGEQHFGLNTLQSRLNIRGGHDQWTRMRQDKLRSLYSALFSSYQRAIVQKYDVKNDSLAKNIISIITILQDKGQLSDNQNQFLNKIESQYNFLNTDRDSLQYINQLQNVVNSLTDTEPLFRCLINHDKLKVDYQDKIISIPFMQPPLGENQSIETDFHNGTVFKWVHGNKEEWTPDTYWIVYMQYSQETAYFRAEIRKADEEIEIITIDDEGNENTVTYHGWMTGPNETTALWNTKKGVIWNDMNYTKLLYITKDEDTLAFFQRFDRIIINGKPWQVQAYNESYSTNKLGDAETGIIRVALKETYTSTPQFVKETIQVLDKQQADKQTYDTTHMQGYIDGPAEAAPYDRLIYIAKNLDPAEWSISNPALAKIVSISQDGKTIQVDVITGFSNKEGFEISYGDLKLKVPIVSL